MPTAITEATPDIFFADLFCGAGGGTTGFDAACRELGLTYTGVAINHWDKAIETHAANYPNVRHLCENIESVPPRTAVPGGKVHLGIFAPECIHHTRARGAKPMNDQSRAGAWHVVRWAEELDIDNIIVENVPEFVDWGPLYPADHPDKSKQLRPIPEQKGLYFRNWKRQLELRGYKTDWKILNSADYGAATARPRFFMLAKKKVPGKRTVITWPEVTHTKTAAKQPDLFGAKPHRPAREIIDWGIRGKSIFNRRKPLAENTLKRIFTGLHKLNGLPFLVPYYSERDGQEPRIHSVEASMPVITTENRFALCTPYLVVFRNHADGQSLEEAMPTICAEGQHLALAQPFLTEYYGGHDAASLDNSLGTITASYEHYALTQPVLVALEHSTEASGHGRRVHSLEKPLGTITTRSGAFGLAEPYIMHVTHEGGDRSRSLERPFPVITGANRGEVALIDPYLINMKGQSNGCSIDKPAPTQTAHAPHLYLAEPFLLPHQHGNDGSDNVRSLGRPMPCITATSSDMFLADPQLRPTDSTLGQSPSALVEPFIIKYYGTGTAVSLDEPLDTCTTKGRFALVHPVLIPALMEVHGGRMQIIGMYDIELRMIQPHELSAATGFPKTYRFAGNKGEQVKQIGNAIVVEQMKALATEMLRPYAEAKQAASRKMAA